MARRFQGREVVATGPLADSATAQLDQLLQEVTVALQLTPTQYRLAEERYRAVGSWLGDPASNSGRSPTDHLPPGLYGAADDREAARG